MRAALLIVGLCAACDGRADPPRKIKHVDRLEEQDRGELIEIGGRVSGTVARMGSGLPHIRFELALAHDGPTIPVVIKNHLPDMFRDGVDVEVVGRWAHTADVRAALDMEGFNDVRDRDVLLAREVFLAPISFQF